jgi:glycosyltransferase involved in cell wall biosynthesis
MLPNLSFFFPVYNEAGNIEKMINNAKNILPQVAEKYEIIIVNDGSKDDSAKIADRLSWQSNGLIRVVHHPQNKGYGMALRSGFSNAKYDYIFYTDGDCQFDLNEMHKLLPLIEDADIVAGIRIGRKDPFYRRFNAHAYNILVRTLFGLPVKDIDCAFKLLRKKAISSLELKSDSQFVSAEFLIKASKKGFRIKQVGVNHYPRLTGKPTGNRLDNVVRSFLELFKLWKSLK